MVWYCHVQLTCWWAGDFPWFAFADAHLSWWCSSGSKCFYQINNDQITFSDPPTPGSDFFGLVIGDTVDVGEPSDGTINAVKLNNGATLQWVV